MDYLLSLHFISNVALEQQYTVEATPYGRGLTSSLTPLFRNLVPANCWERRAMMVRNIGRPYTDTSSENNYTDKKDRQTHILNWLMKPYMMCMTQR